MKVAIVHYWLVGMRGGEKVVEALCELFPGADLYTHVYDPDAVSETIRRHDVRTTFIQRLPRARRLYRSYLPLMPWALRRLDLSGYDLVISSESGPAKGVVTGRDTLHVCYCNTPMRYLWDMYETYRSAASLPTRLAMSLLAPPLRRWDRATADGVDHFVANSENVRDRIRRHYGREAEVIFPPVDVDSFAPVEERRPGTPRGAAGRPEPDRPAGELPAAVLAADDEGGFYLFVGQLTAYKRPRLAVRTFNRMGRRLVVVGGGEQRRELERLAGPAVEVLGRQPADVVRRLYDRCRAVVFPGEEDFGLVPVEAMAAGRPVIAFRGGGAMETIVEGRTGVFFDEPIAPALCEAVRCFEALETTFDPATLRRRARRFDRKVFDRRMRATVNGLREERGEGPAAVREVAAHQ